MDQRSFIKMSVVIAVSLVSVEVFAKPSSSEVKWKQKMHELYQSLTETMTDVSSDQRFNAPANRKRIEKNAQKLASGAHELTISQYPADLDPSIRMMANLFQDETKRAYSALKSGNRSYARDILRNISSYCVSCHTRNGSGPSFSQLPLEPSTQSLSSLELGRFYAATRQYDRAFTAFEKIVKDNSASVSRPLEWESAVRYGLSIAVRVKKNPDQAMTLVDSVIQSKNAPYFLKKDAQQWKQSLLEWKEEKSNSTKTEENLRNEAVRLMAKAHEIQKYPADRSADIIYLRASATVHELLQLSPNGKSTGEAFLIAGMCYEALRTLNIDDIHEVYYESCIRKVPHTATSEACYQRYEQSTYFGFTGSGGSSLPTDIEQKLKNLEALAHPHEISQPN